MKLKPLILAIGLSASLLRLPQAWAQEVRLFANELKVFPVDEPKRVAVGDPEIADVTILNNRELMLLAKKAGTTTLIIWDKSGQYSYKINVIEQDLTKIAKRLKGLLADSDIVGVKLKVQEDKIYVLGNVLSQYELDKIREILATFPTAINLVNIKERQPLVEIDVEVMEISYGDLKNLGMDWSNSLPITYSEPTGANTEGDLPKLWKVLSWDRTGITGKLNFLVSQDKARTLANPKLVTLSGKEASFLVGGEVPYITVESEGRTEVQWRNYGVNLKILPAVNSNNEIRTQIKADVSDLDWANAVTHQGYNIPALKKREAQTELFLNDEDTIFLAGLIKNEDSRNIERLPWLSKIPVLGELFKSTDFRDKRTELVISVSPRIIGEKPEREDKISKMEEGDKPQAISAPTPKLSKSPPAYSEESSPLAYYTNMVEDIIARNVVYPEACHRAQLEGTVEVGLSILPNGQLKESKILQSSGVRTLDEAVLSTVQGLAPYPAFPSQLTQEELRLTVPVVFRSYVKNE